MSRNVVYLPFFPSLALFMYNKHIFTLDRATLLYVTGRPSNVHFLAARGSLSSGKPFVGKAFPTKKIGAFAASNVAQGSCAHQTTKLLLNFPSMHTRAIWPILKFLKDTEVGSREGARERAEMPKEDWSRRRGSNYWLNSKGKIRTQGGNPKGHK